MSGACSSRRPLSRILLLSLLLMVWLPGGCGFKLRGSLGEPLILPPLLVSGGTVELRRLLEQGLRAGGVEVVGEQAVEGLVLQVLDEQRGRRVLSVDSRGRVQEYELSYVLRFMVTDRQGQERLAPQSVTQRRAYAFADTEVLAKSSEEQQLYSDMRHEAVREVLMRLRSLSQRMQQGATPRAAAAAAGGQP